MTRETIHHPSDNEGDSHAWRTYREWYILCLEAFFRCLHAEPGRLDFRFLDALLDTRPFPGKRIKEFSDLIRELDDDLCCVMSEAIAVRDALPGEFDELVSFLEKRLNIVKECTTEGDVYAAIENEEAW